MRETRLGFCHRASAAEPTDLGTSHCMCPLDMKVSESIREAVMTHVDYDAKMAQEVCSEDRVFDVGGTNIHRNMRRSPRSSVRDRFLCVRMEVLLTACSVRWSGCL